MLIVRNKKHGKDGKMLVLADKSMEKIVKCVLLQRNIQQTA